MNNARKNNTAFYSCGIARITVNITQNKKYQAVIQHANNDFIELYKLFGNKKSAENSAALPGISINDLLNCHPEKKAAQNTNGNNAVFEWLNPDNQRHYIIYVYPHNHNFKHTLLYSNTATPFGGSGSNAHNPPALSSRSDGNPIYDAEAADEGKNFDMHNKLVSPPEGKTADPQSLSYTIIYIDDTQNKILQEEFDRTYRRFERLDGRCNELMNAEKTRLSAELHDHVGQALTALKLDLFLISEQLSDTAKCREKIMDLLKLTDETMRITQQIAAGLLPGMPVGDGLTGAIREYCSRFEQRTGIECTFESDISYTGKGQTALALYRITQEALTNVARHAQATNVLVTLTQKHDGIALTVTDNGTGIPQKCIASEKSLGLNGMRRRAAACGGEIWFMENENGGTKIHTLIPLIDG